MKLSIEQFAGEMPVVAEHLLPIQNATATLNARLEGGSLMPIREEVDAPYSAPANTVNSWAIYPFDKTKVLTRTDQADFVRGALANDAWKRVYIAGDVHKPQVAYMEGGALMVDDLGINRPQTPTIPSSWDDAKPTDPNSQVVRCAYFVTNVTSRGEESEPSHTTQIISRWDGATIPITLGASNDVRAATRRIYRTEGGGTFNFVAEIPASTTTYNDSVASRLLGAPCPSENWNAPPDKLTGLVMVGNGFMASFFDNTLCFCEPYQPHAWPLDYQLAFPDKIVSIATIGGSLIVTTTGLPWIVSGIHPAAMSQTSLDLRAAGLSRTGHVDMGDFSLYPAPEGLMMASMNGVQLTTRAFFSKQQWLALMPERFKAFRYRGQYLCFGGAQSFVFNLDHGLFPLTVGNPGDEVLSAHYQADEDQLYLLIKNTAGERRVVVFDSGENKQMSWVSREFIMQSNAVLSCGRIDAETTATLEINGDNYSHTHETDTDKGFRIPAGRPRRMKLKLTSSGRINSVALSSSMGELL